MLTLLDTDVTAPTVYWTTIEASLAIVAATLPTLRPIFSHMSPESVIASIRSVLSLHSIRSTAASKTGSNGAREGTKSSSSSVEGLNSDPALDGYPGTHETFVEGPGLHLTSMSRETHEHQDGIVVQKTWERSDSSV